MVVKMTLDDLERAKKETRAAIELLLKDFAAKHNVATRLRGDILLNTPVGQFEPYVEVILEVIL